LSFLEIQKTMKLSIRYFGLLGRFLKIQDFLSLSRK